MDSLVSFFPFNFIHHESRVVCSFLDVNFATIHSLLTMRIHGVSILLLSPFAAVARAAQGSDLNFKATFGKTPAPFQIDVDEEFIAQTKLRVGLTRLPTPIDQPGHIEGPALEDAISVRDHWVNDYDWFQVQQALNEQYFTSPNP